MGLWLPGQLGSGFILSYELSSMGSESMYLSLLSFLCSACDSHLTLDPVLPLKKACVRVKARDLVTGDAPLCRTH